MRSFQLSNKAKVSQKKSIEQSLYIVISYDLAFI